MDYTTGLTDDEFDELLVRLREEGVEGYPPILGLSGSLRATLIHLRHNIVQAAIGELLGVSQPTISRAVKVLTEAFPRVLEGLLLTQPRMCPRAATFVWTALSSPAGVGAITANCGRGERGTTGMSARILVLPGGRPVRASDPYPGSVHDVAALDSSGLLEGIDPSGWIADKGYIGRGMITPHKKPPNGELSEAAKEANKSINKIRQVVERTIAHIKSWRILHTDYRRPLHTFEQTITAALSLHVFKTTL